PRRRPSSTLFPYTTLFRSLVDIGAMRDGAITDLGTKLSALPLHPRLGRALLECGPQAAVTIAALSDSPSGNIATAQPPQREVKRLRNLVSDSPQRSEEHTSELQSRFDLVCRLLLEKKKIEMRH